MWNDAARSISVRLLYPEARAALAKAARMGRITGCQLAAGVGELETIITEVDHIEMTAELAHAAGVLAQAHGLRGYDAVHLAAALAASDAEFVLATGDTDLASAAQSLGISIAFTG